MASQGTDIFVQELATLVQVVRPPPPAPLFDDFRCVLGRVCSVNAVLVGDLFASLSERSSVSGLWSRRERAGAGEKAGGSFNR